MGNHSNLAKTIVKKIIEVTLDYCANGSIEFRSTISKTRPKQGIKDKWEDGSNVSNTIMKQRIEGSLGYCANSPIGFSSPMSKTMPKQFIEEIWEDCSNISKAIVKQDIEGNLVYFTNGPMTIGKSDFEGGMATYSQKWNTAEICKRKSAGRIARIKEASGLCLPTTPR